MLQPNSGLAAVKSMCVELLTVLTPYETSKPCYLLMNAHTECSCQDTDRDIRKLADTFVQALLRDRNGQLSCNPNTCVNAFMHI